MADNLLVDLYYETYKKCEAIHGKICLLMEVGSFYEIYSRPDHTGSNAEEIARDLNMKLTRKNSNKGDASPHMTGFPVVAETVKVRILLDKGYTVLIMAQSAADTARPSARRTREITRVISKGTDLDSTRVRNNVVSICIDRWPRGALSIGMCSIDTLVSREILVHEIHSAPEDKGLAMDSAIEFISRMEPVECIIVTKNGECHPTIVKQLSLDPSCVVHYMDVQACQRSRLEQPDSVALHETRAVDGLYAFLQDHFYSIQDIVLVPYHEDQHLDLSSSAICQLDVALLYESIDVTLTAMGTRLLRDRLVRPLLSSSDLEVSYGNISELSSEAEDLIKRSLLGLPDLDKLHRRMSLGRLTGYGMRALHAAYLQALPVLTASPALHDVARRVTEMVQDYTAVLELKSEEDDDCDLPFASVTEKNRNNGNGNGNIVSFVPGRHSDLDHHMNIKRHTDHVISEFLKVAKSAVPCETYKMKDTLGMQTTHQRAETIKKKVHRSSWKIRKVSKYSYLYTSELESALAAGAEADDEINKLGKMYFDAYLLELYEHHHDTMELFTRKLAELDFIRCGKVLARTRRLSRPKLVDRRCANIVGLRHLIIEQLQPETRYVPNDCLLDGSSGRLGMTLYGVNACGKSSYLKGVGLAVIMAQAGLYAPAESMTFKPFKRIMTRIAGGDSIVKGQSSFIMELLDLGSVVNRADEDTLILGDEMCRGTEIASAEALVCTTLQHLVDKGTPFVTATHLHGIAEDIAAMPGVDVFHMEVSFDKDGEPIYNRKLVAGPGAAFYGLEVARAQGFNHKFMQRAMQFRNGRISSVVSAGRPSHFNKWKILFECEVCKYRPVGRNALPLDTHHLQFQCNADEDGYHDTQHKDALHNLVALCKMCHIAVHRPDTKLVVEQGLKGRRVSLAQTVR